MRKIKIKAEIEFEVSIYDVEELKGKTDLEISEYILKNMGCRLYEKWELYENGFINLPKGITDIALHTEDVKILNFSFEEILEKEFINSLKK